MASEDGTGDQKSFADCLKETNDDSDKDNQTANTPRPHSSPKRAAGNQGEPHRKTDLASPSAVLADTVNQPPILDTRSLRLSLLSGHTAGGAKAHAHTLTAPIDSLAAVPKGQVAFGVSIAKPAGNSATATEQGNAETTAQQGESNAKDSDGQPDTSDHGAAVVAAALKDSTQTAVGTAVVASPPINPVVPQPVSAYTSPQTYTPVAPVAPTAPAAPVLEPPVTPALRSHSIDIQVPGSDGDQVDVRVSQRAGDVQVTVRTPDNNLAESLRQHLPELSDRLSQTGTPGEVWQPTAAAETSTGYNHSHDESASNGQAQQQQNGQPQADPDSEQNQRSGQWVDNFFNAE